MVTSNFYIFFFCRHKSVEQGHDRYKFIYTWNHRKGWAKWGGGGGLYHLFVGTVEPLYNEVLGTMKITLLYQVSHYIRVKKLRNIKSWDQQNYLVIRGFCYIRPRYNEVPLYMHLLH